MSILTKIKFYDELPFVCHDIAALTDLDPDRYNVTMFDVGDMCTLCVFTSRYCDHDMYAYLWEGATALPLRPPGAPESSLGTMHFLVHSVERDHEFAHDIMPDDKPTDNDDAIVKQRDLIAFDEFITNIVERYS